MNKTLAYYVTLLRKDFTSYCNEQLQELELSQGLLYFILYIGKHPGCSPTELAHMFHMDTGYVTRSLSKLEKGGFLCQTCDTKDHRVHILTLQAKGDHAFRVSHELFALWDDMVMKNISESDQAQLLALLERVVQTKRGDDGV